MITSLEEMIELPNFDHKTTSIIKFTTQKMKFSINDIFSKYDQIGRKLRICSHLLKKSLMENCIFCAVICVNMSLSFKLMLYFISMIFRVVTKFHF